MDRNGRPRDRWAAAPADAVLHALAEVTDAPLWLDPALASGRPASRPPLDGDLEVDLAVVGGGLTGCWTALLALERNPSASVVLLEAADLAWAASGRNGGFCSSSLTHGLGNGLDRWPAEVAELTRLGTENLDQIERTVARYQIGCDFTRSGELSIAVAPWQLDGLRELHRTAADLDEDLELLDAVQTRALVDSPTYLGSLRDRRGTAVLDPARLVWGLAGAAQGLGATVHERTRVTGMSDEGGRVRLQTSSGTVRARHVVLGTNAFPSLLRRVRPFVVPVWDHVLATEPLSASQRASIGWSGDEGLSDAGNRFHYYRVTADGRIVWGGYDALYYYGADLSAGRNRSPATERLLAAHFFETFPQLEGLRFSHAWGGAVDTCTRFAAFWERAMSGKVCSVQGYTGLGVGASRFAGQVALDLVVGRDTERTRLEMVRTRPLPFPPEPVRWAGIELTRRSLALADARQGRRNLWLRTLDRLGLGFDS
jgi:glycine/D-amino acid oxidase-like deaminating enzyme